MTVAISSKRPRACDPTSQLTRINGRRESNNSLAVVSALSMAALAVRQLTHNRNTLITTVAMPTRASFSVIITPSLRRGAGWEGTSWTHGQPAGKGGDLRRTVEPQINARGTRPKSPARVEQRLPSGPPPCLDLSLDTLRVVLCRSGHVSERQIVADVSLTRSAHTGLPRFRRKRNRSFWSQTV